MRNRRGHGVHAAIAAIAMGGVMAAVGVAGAQTQDTTIGIEDQTTLAFVPAEVTVSVGSTVTWNFDGSTAVHNARSTNEVPADPSWEPFDTGFKISGTASRQFTALGEYTFVCDAHPAMVGKITVVDGPVESDPDTDADPASAEHADADAVTLSDAAGRRADAGSLGATRRHRAPARRWTRPLRRSRSVRLRAVRRGARGARSRSPRPATCDRPVQAQRELARCCARRGSSVAPGPARSHGARLAAGASGRYVVEIEARDARATARAVRARPCGSTR